MDLKMTVNGYMELYYQELEQMRICWRHNPPIMSEAWREGKKHSDAAVEYRQKAYDLMGVKTVTAPTQLSFFEAL